MQVGKSESSSFWMGVLTDLKARSVQDILITCTDNMNGFIEAITLFSLILLHIYICVVHQIRNSYKYVVYKDKKEFIADINNIYNATNKEMAVAELDCFEENWEGNIRMQYCPEEKTGMILLSSSSSQWRLENHLYHKSDRKSQCKNQKVHESKTFIPL